MALFCIPIVVATRTAFISVSLESGDDIVADGGGTERGGKGRKGRILFAAIFFHDSLKIARSIQDAKHFNSVWRYTIKEYIAVDNNAPQTWGKFLARSANF